MSSAWGNEGGIPRRRQSVASPPGGASRIEDLSGANEAKTDKLQKKNLERRARARGFELRHSAYGYALIDAARNRVDDRNDMTLVEIESWLEQA